MLMTWEYVAGFFDGEGWITLYRTDRNRYGRSVKLGMSQNNREVLFVIKKFLESKGLERIGLYKSHKRKTSCLLIQNKFDIEKFLNGVEPMLIVKAAKCREAREFMSKKWMNIGHFSEAKKIETCKVYEECKNFMEASRRTNVNRSTIMWWVKKKRCK